MMMIKMSTLVGLLVGLQALVQAVQALNPVVVKGNYLYDSVTKQRFYVKGMAYGRDTEASLRDYWLPAMQAVRNVSSEINTVRIYRVHPTIHASQYQLFRDATPSPPTPAAPAPCSCGKLCNQGVTTTANGAWCKFTTVNEAAANCVYEPTAPEGFCAYTVGSAPPSPFEVDADYDSFMKEMEKLGLYVMVPLTPAGREPWTYCALGRDGTKELSDHSCYPSCLLSYAMAVMNTFSKYPNTLGYVIGNEVFDSPEAFASAPCIKSFNRDVKQYMRSCPSQRIIPTIYATADRPLPGLPPAQTNALKMDYLTCGPWSDRVDIFGMNVYRWCGVDDDMTTSGYGQMAEALNHSNGPLLLTEFGCALTQPRNWRMLEQLYGQDSMAPLWSGGTAYAYGNTGGPEFALFGGGPESREPVSEPGHEQVCVAGANNQPMCSVDLFAAQLGQASAPPSPLQGEASCSQVPIDPRSRQPYADRPPECPLYEEFFTAETNALAKTRMYAPGWVGVNCPAGKLGPALQADKDCLLPGPGRPCMLGGWCTVCTVEGPFPDHPECREGMAWMSQNWYDSDVLDGSICTWQAVLASEGKCPAPNVSLVCDAGGLCIDRALTPPTPQTSPTKAPVDNPAPAATGLSNTTLSNGSLVGASSVLLCLCLLPSFLWV